MTAKDYRRNLLIKIGVLKKMKIILGESNLHKETYISRAIKCTQHGLSAQPVKQKTYHFTKIM